MNKDVLHIANIPGVEPEEQPVTREVDLSIGVKGSLTGETLGQMNSSAQITRSALEVATGLRRICANCKHFDQIKARAVFEEASKTQDGQIELRNLYSNLMGIAAPLNVVIDDLYPLGFCHAFSSLGKDMIVHPLSNCPTESAHLGFSDQFQPLDRSAIRRGDLGYDAIMKRAAGEEPKS